ncbi:hypothetical protein BCR34DRAFT_599428 [Clohesyomyces aquaticus]|uniref:Nephrocystin 3-like N-terminal domain-containing protein n=1 Tax=Clohesyomyces aquaticus TaxID=1231657 RepID=A0A1Y1ZUS3_9PLEO|nr:hypothetical protein BCR34DRAFT_599428 [Clohesyomyces aquaticus]
MFELLSSFENRIRNISLSAFIWNEGSSMQRSQSGVLLSLLHELLSKHRMLSFQLLVISSGSVRGVPSDWSRLDLERTFVETLHTCSGSMCLFIDGLDEIDRKIEGGLPSLLSLISTLKDTPGLKICVASRPELQIQDELASFPRLLLQELTRADIYSYTLGDIITVEHANDWLVSTSPPAFAQEPIPQLADIIVTKAEGVFLWVHLVLSGIRNGLVNYDSWDMLMERIEALPSELNELYETIWRRFSGENPLYQHRAALYFNLLNFDWFSGMPFLQLMFASDSPSQKPVLGDGVRFSAKNLITACEILHRQLWARCGGFVEVIQGGNSARIPGGHQSEEAMLFSKLEYFRHYRVKFIHRSAHEFLTKTTEGRKILGYDENPAANHVFALVLA